MAALDALLPLDDSIGDIKDNAVAGTYQGAFLNGKIYGLASFTSVFGFERNCDVIEKAGLDCAKPPETWDDLLVQAEAITKAGNGEYYGYTLQGPAGFSMGAPFRIYVYLLEFGANFAKPDAATGLDTPWFNDPKAAPVYTFLRELAKSTPPGLLFEADEGKVYTQLFQGKSAYQMAGGWHVQWAQEFGCTELPVLQRTPAERRPARDRCGCQCYLRHHEDQQEPRRGDEVDQIHPARRRPGAGFHRQPAASPPPGPPWPRCAPALTPRPRPTSTRCSTAPTSTPCPSGSRTPRRSGRFIMTSW